MRIDWLAKGTVLTGNNPHYMSLWSSDPHRKLAIVRVASNDGTPDGPWGVFERLADDLQLSDPRASVPSSPSSRRKRTSG